MKRSFIALPATVVILAAALASTATVRGLPERGSFAATQTATATATSAGYSAAGFVDEAITASNQADNLAVRLHIDPADKGQAHFTAAIVDHGHTLVDAQVRITLTPLQPPNLGVSFVTLSQSRGSYSGAGLIAEEGLWRADVQVRASSGTNTARSVPFIFLAGPAPTFLTAPSINGQFGAATVRITGDPGAAATVRVRLLPKLRARFAVTMPDMDPEFGDLRQEASGWYSGVLVPSMEGFMNLEVQVYAHGGWQRARTIVLEVDGNFRVLVLA